MSNVGVNWTCPHCGRDVTITDERRTVSLHTNRIENVGGRHTLVSRFIVCPNSKCKKYTLVCSLYESSYKSGIEELKANLGNWDLVPASSAKHFPPYVPKAILEDYLEACLIKGLSPKAAATLARRCIQGILRDYWNVKPGRLVDEIESIKDKIDPLTWSAIDSVRKVGNIGAHMEKDINLIVEVEPHEANLLIELIENLLKDWYVAREERKVRLTIITDMAAQKDGARKPK